MQTACVGAAWVTVLYKICCESQCVPRFNGNENTCVSSSDTHVLRDRPDSLQTQSICRQSGDTVLYPGRITPLSNIMHSVTYLDNKGSLQTTPGVQGSTSLFLRLFLCSFNHSHFLWWIHFQILFSCSNMFWNVPLSLIKKAFALGFSSNHFFTNSMLQSKSFSWLCLAGTLPYWPCQS